MSEREQVRAVSQEWKKSHRDPECRMRDGRTAGEIAARLDALDPETATAEDVFAAIGHRSWACQQTCDECGEESWSCVEIGEEPNDESCTATICEGCLRKALALIEWERLAEEARALSERDRCIDVVGRAIDRAKNWRVDIVRSIDWNKVVRDWADEAVGSGPYGSDPAHGLDWSPYGSDPAHGLDWTAVVDTPKDGAP